MFSICNLINLLQYRSIAFFFIIKVLYGRRLSNLQMMKLLTLIEQFQKSLSGGIVYYSNYFQEVL